MTVNAFWWRIGPYPSYIRNLDVIAHESFVLAGLCHKGKLRQTVKSHLPGTTYIVLVFASLEATNIFSGRPGVRAFWPIVKLQSPACSPRTSPVTILTIGPGFDGIYSAKVRVSFPWLCGDERTHPGIYGTCSSRRQSRCQHCQACPRW